LVFHLHLSLSLLQTLLGADKALPFLTAVFLSVMRSFSDRFSCFFYDRGYPHQYLDEW
jgi:hypothetical protein